MQAASKNIVVYISMGFGNPYGDEWSPLIVMKCINQLSRLGVGIFSIADTTGMASEKSIDNPFACLCPAYPGLEFGAHFHVGNNSWRERVSMAYAHGIRRFDSAILGFGGCPMAADTLVGNLATDKLLQFAQEKGLETRISPATVSQLELKFQQLVNPQ